MNKGGLVVTLREGEFATVGDDISISVTKVWQLKGIPQVRVRINAPVEMKINRPTTLPHEDPIKEATERAVGEKKETT